MPRHLPDPARPPSRAACPLFMAARSGDIVSAHRTIPQVWSYDGVPLRVGRLELAATVPASRRGRLVSALMALAHEPAPERGGHMQVIKGTPCRCSSASGRSTR